MAPPNTQNIILYGPPGTGKTHAAIRRALDLVLSKKERNDVPIGGEMETFRKLKGEGRIEFVTFHQSYGYEDFVEGIRPTLTDDEESLGYSNTDGVFKRLAATAIEVGRRQLNRPTYDEIHSEFIASLEENGDQTFKSKQQKTYTVTASSRGNFLLHLVEEKENANRQPLTASSKKLKILWDSYVESSIDATELTVDAMQDLLSTPEARKGIQFTGLWIIFNAMLKINRSNHPSTRDGRRGKSASFTDSTPQFVLIIDEINRGNISKIFGELITLLEPDKRIGAPDALTVTLPTSQEQFAVPPNLHVIGTMNTADRSIALMDIALRRRFTFEELLPDADALQTVLQEKKAGIKWIGLVREIFTTLNDRIRLLYDRDHQLGHSFFLKAVTPEELRWAFVDNVIPLLQEYFYGDWAKICMVLGCPYDTHGAPLRQGDAEKHVRKSPTEYAAPWIIAQKIEAKTRWLRDGADDESLDYIVNPQFMRNAASPGQPLLEAFLGILSSETQDAVRYKNQLSDLKKIDFTNPPSTKSRS